MALCDKGIEAVWALGRLLRLFDVPLIPRKDRCEKCMMDYQFAATCREETGLVAYPFWCGDYYGKTGLYFGGSFTNRSLKKRIGGAFWGLVLSATEVRDYESELYHTGGGFTARFGIKHGASFYREEGSAELNACYRDLLRKLKKLGVDEGQNQ